MSAKTSRDALHGIFATVVPSLTLIKGEPNNIANTPALYTIREGFDVEDTDTGELKSVTYRFMHRLVMTYQDNEVAEDTLMDITDAILDAVIADPKLGGLLHHTGRATIRSGDDGFTEIPANGTLYRTCDLASEVIEVSKNA